MPDDPPEAPPTAGPIAGKYELVRLIGRGGMGTVWEGRHTTLGSRVAIKFIDVEYADSAEARTRFDNEARAAANIQSKHAIQIFDHGVTQDGKPYIVMELLLGEPLDNRLDRLGRIPLAETARILRQVARALTRAHERGIVHRDLKPENIFLVRGPDDDDEIAKVLDFGIAKFKKVDGGGMSGGVPTSSTKTGAVLGTPFYMAPEQARGLREIDHRCDLWSMGVIAFKCVCGTLPFEGVSVGDLLVKICTTPAPTPSVMVPSLGPAFDAWFQRALEKDPARRFQTALELSDSLAYAAGLSVRRGGSGVPSSGDLAFGAPAVSGPPAARSGADQPSATAGSATSAPFTSPSRRTGATSRSAVFFAIAATVIGSGVAATSVVYFRSAPRPQGEVTEGMLVRAQIAPTGAMAPALATVDSGKDENPSTGKDERPNAGSADGSSRGSPPKTAPPKPIAPSKSAQPVARPALPAAKPGPPPALPSPKPTTNAMDPGY
jgi:serine/threonine protein kinase